MQHWEADAALQRVRQEPSDSRLVRADGRSADLIREKERSDKRPGTG